MEEEEQAERKQLHGEIDELLRRYAATWADSLDGGAILSSWYVVGDLILVNGAHTLVELSDENGGKYQKMGMLWAALHDPRWLPEHES